MKVIVAEYEIKLVLLLVQYCFILIWVGLKNSKILNYEGLRKYIIIKVIIKMRYFVIHKLRYLHFCNLPYSQFYFVHNIAHDKLSRIPSMDTILHQT